VWWVSLDELGSAEGVAGWSNGSYARQRDKLRLVLGQSREAFGGHLVLISMKLDSIYDCLLMHFLQALNRQTL
jgi:hypothetical protein